MRRGTVWAVVLIVVGVWFLLDNLGLLGGRGWSIFWPLVLIAIGLSLILAGRGPRRAVPVIDSLSLDGATRARLTFRHGAGRLIVRGGAGPDELYSGLFAGGVEKAVTRTGETMDVALGVSRQERPYLIGPWSWSRGHAGLEWDVRLSAAPALELVFETGASESRVDMTGLRIERFQVKTGASSTEIVAPDRAGFTHGRISSGAAAVKLTVPPGVAARISGTMGLGAMHVDLTRFPKQPGGYYESPGFADAADRLEVEIDGGVGVVTVR